MNKYELHRKIVNGYIYARVEKGMYGMPQAGKIANHKLKRHLEQYGYVPVRITAGLWRHKKKTANIHVGGG